MSLKPVLALGFASAGAFACGSSNTRAIFEVCLRKRGDQKVTPSKFVLFAQTTHDVFFLFTLSFRVLSFWLNFLICFFSWLVNEDERRQNKFLCQVVIKDIRKWMYGRLSLESYREKDDVVGPRNSCKILKLLFIYVVSEWSLLILFPLLWESIVFSYIYIYILVKIMGFLFCVHFNRSKTKIQNQMITYIFFCF